jgi:hypothetical protein
MSICVFPSFGVFLLRRGGKCVLVNRKAVPPLLGYISRVLGSVMAWTLIAAFSVDLDVRGGSTCPTPTEVAERAGPLLSVDRGLPPGLILRVDDVGPAPSNRQDDPAQVLPFAPSAEIEVSLERDGDLTPVASRRLARHGACIELAEAAAVVVATWAARYDTPVPRNLAPEETIVAEPLLRVTTSPVPRHLITWSLGGSAWMGTATEGGFAPQGSVEVTARVRGTHWFGRVLVAGAGERSFPVGAASAGWRRLIVLPSVGRIWGESIFWEVSAGPVAGPVFVNGQGFSPNHGDVALDIGFSPTARLGFRPISGSGTAVWLGTSAIAWLRPHRLSVDMSTSRFTLPWLDLLAGVGLTYAFSH